MDIAKIEVGQREFAGSGEWTPSCPAKKVYDEAVQISQESDKRFEMDSDPRAGSTRLYDFYLRRTK